jgi:hypothetical protein
MDDIHPGKDVILNHQQDRLSDGLFWGVVHIFANPEERKIPTYRLPTGHGENMARKSTANPIASAAETAKPQVTNALQRRGLLPETYSSDANVRAKPVPKVSRNTQIMNFALRVSYAG